MPKPTMPDLPARRALRPHRMRAGLWGLLLACVTGAPAQAADPTAPIDLAELQRQVEAAERSFAQSMADRDLDAFSAHVADDAVFFGRDSVHRGREAVVAAWTRFFESPQAPFSWYPDQVEVLASGQLAHSSGPVLDPSGNPAGRFNSVWRREADGRWRVVFDRGEPPCRCAPAAKKS